MKLTKIENITPVRDFPNIYNGNIDELVSEINRLNDVITAKDEEIRSLESDFNSALKKIRAEYLALFAQLNNGNSD
jgi:predicted  nucleic acid-binding Zn-ribbon protein